MGHNEEYRVPISLKKHTALIAVGYGEKKKKKGKKRVGGEEERVEERKIDLTKPVQKKEI